MTKGFQDFLKMQEIDKHVSQDAQWWEGEGLHPALIADVLRAVAQKLDPPRAVPSWEEQWEAVRPWCRNAR